MEDTDCQIGKRVLVTELNVEGTIYESGLPDFSVDRIYGIRFDKTVFPVNFIATTVWHCKASELSEDRNDYLEQLEMDNIKLIDENKKLKGEKMFSELSLEYTPIDMSQDKNTINTESGCWIARFKEQGITAYGKTLEIATEKATKMLKEWYLVNQVSLNNKEC